MKISVTCETCGRSFKRYRCQIRAHTFCSRECAKAFTSKRMTDYNRTENPKNTSDGWSWEQREAVRKREQRNKGPCKPGTYPKYHGRHAHRVAAEEAIGRPLQPGEVVHHKNEDTRDYTPGNLQVFENQAAHAEYHARTRKEVV